MEDFSFRDWLRELEWEKAANVVGATLRHSFSTLQGCPVHTSAGGGE